MIEWSEYNSPLSHKGIVNGCEVADVQGSFRHKGQFLITVFNKRETLRDSDGDQAKAKAEELLTEWLTTAIKDLPEDKLAELRAVKAPNCDGCKQDCRGCGPAHFMCKAVNPTKEDIDEAMKVVGQ